MKIKNGFIHLLQVGRSTGHSNPEWVIAGLQWLLEQEKNGKLPISDIIYIPHAFPYLRFDLYDLISDLSNSGKIIICATGRCSIIDAERICYPGFYGDVICIG